MMPSKVRHGSLRESLLMADRYCQFRDDSVLGQLRDESVLSQFRDDSVL